MNTWKALLGLIHKGQHILCMWMQILEAEIKNTNLNSKLKFLNCKFRKINNILLFC